MKSFTEELAGWYKLLGIFCSKLSNIYDYDYFFFIINGF